MASIARRTLMNLLDCIRCFFLRGIETSAWIPLSFYTDQRHGLLPTKGVLEKQTTTTNWNGVQMQTKTATMLLNITQTVQELKQTTATVALIAASLTAPVGSILLTAPTCPKTGMMDNKAKDKTKCVSSLPEISCSLIDSTPTYCYFVINSSNGCIRKSTVHHAFEKRKNFKAHTDTEVDNDANNNSFNDDDDDNNVTSTIKFSSMILPRQRTFSESSDDNFICFVNEDNDDDDDLDGKASSGSSKNYGYYSNQYDTETDYSSDDSCDEEDDEEEDEDCVMLTEKKVRFDPKPTVHVMRTWNFAYRSARKGDWENAARDRVRFQTRIQRAAMCLDPILKQEHRQKIYETRFAPPPLEHSLTEPHKLELDKPF